jgi:hypothetical protein
LARASAGRGAFFEGGVRVVEKVIIELDKQDAVKIKNALIEAGYYVEVRALVAGIVSPDIPEAKRLFLDVVDKMMVLYGTRG